jgi:ubiquinone/menaquinone biosynthesis C-methylase UbiE
MPNMNKDTWRIWNQEDEYGQVFYKRATGEFPEMESSKAVANLLKDIIQDSDRILDVGCGSGHYLKSLISTINCNFLYTGIDATFRYIELAKKAFSNQNNTEFMVGDIFDIPVEDNRFDVVMCNNVLLHLPSVQKPINELIRVSKRFVVIRTLIGN